MSMNPVRAFTVSTLALLLTGVLLAGCSTPGEDSRGRIDPYMTTDRETRSAQPNIPAMLEYTDQVAQQVAQQVATIPQVAAANAAGQRVTVLVGDINNKTWNVSSHEFEMLRSRIRASLLQSQFMKDKVRFAESRHRMAAIGEREGVITMAEQPKWDPETTFALNGDFYRLERGSPVNQYYFEFQLVHFKTNEIVFSEKVDLKQYKQK